MADSATPSTAQTPATFRGAKGIVLESLLLASVALFFLNFNPLGALSTGHRYSQDLVYAWFGHTNWLYPRMPPSDGAVSHPRSRVVVLLIDDSALALRGAHWPVSMSFHAQMLAELEVLKPRAVMLDFLLMDAATPTATCAFVSEVQRLRAGGTATYVAVTRPDELAALDAGECRDDAGHPLVPKDVLHPVSVRLQVDSTDFVNRRYPFEDRAPDDPAGAGLASAALRMYCDSTSGPADCSTRLRRDRSADAGFELAWSPTGDPFNQRWSRARCEQLPSPTHAILFKAAMPRDTQCPPIATMFATALLSPNEDSSLGMRNEDLFRLMEGSFVLVGGNFRGAGDLMTTPLHTRLPGIYYHAVALDNLLAFDGQPKVRKEYRAWRIRYYLFDLAVLWLLAVIYLWRQRWVSGGQRTGPFALSESARKWIADFLGDLPTTRWVIAVVAILLCVAASPVLQWVGLGLAAALLVTLEIRISTHRDLADRLKSLVLYVAAQVLSLAVVAVAIWIGYRWMSLPPVDWVGYLSFAAVGFFVAHTAILEFARQIDMIHGTRHPQKLKT